MFKGTKYALRFISIMVLFAIFTATAYADENVTEENAVPHIVYSTDLINGDWTEEASDGELCGFTGPSGAIEGIKIRLENIEGGVTYRVYLASGGWQEWKSNGEEAGNPGQANAIQAIEVKLTGRAAQVLNLYYASTIDVDGELDWARNGQPSGSVEKGRDLLQIKMMLNGQNEPAPGAMDRAVVSDYQIGWHNDSSGRLSYRATPAIDFTGWIDRAENASRYYIVNNYPVTGWQYIDGLKFYFEDDGRLLQNVEPLIGAQPEYQIHVNKLLNCVTIYAKDGNNGFIIPVKAMLCSVGDDTPLGTFYTPEKYRWRLMVNDTYTQYATRLTAGKGFLFHSVTYTTPDIYDLIAYGYNGLGVVRSLGCIRLTAENAKWIYDNCKIGTTVKIYDDATSVGPFYRPVLEPIPETQKWDPTDPNVIADIAAGKGPAAEQIRQAQAEQESINQVAALEATLDV